MYLRCIPDTIYKGTKDKENERRNIKEIPHNPGVLQSEVITMVRGSLLPARFRLNPTHLFAPLTVTSAEVLDRIVLPELPLEEFIFDDVDEVTRTVEGPGRRPAQILGLSERGITLKAYVNEITGICPLCGNAGVEKEHDKEESD
jgi:hypothetical protein